MKNQKELVFKIVWRVSLGILTLMTVFNVLYYGIEDTLVLGNEFFMIVLVCSPILAGFCSLVWGLHQAISVFLRDAQNYANQKSFAWYFWKPLFTSLLAFALGFLSFVLSFAFFCLIQEPVTDAPVVFVGWIEFAYDAALQMYLLAYILSVIFAGGVVAQKKLIF